MAEEREHPNGELASSKTDDTLLFAEDERTKSVSRCPLWRVGDYELLEEIAAGGMGIVYRARQVSLNRLVEVKMIRFANSASGKERQRFLAEAEAVAALSHPNIVPIYEVGECDGQPFYSMQLITGGSLAESISRGDWPVADNATCRRAANLVATLAHAVHDAHCHGIIHRDVKPGNVLLDDEGCPYLTDFGLAKQFHKGDALTLTGEIIGTPAFMSPEQAAGQAATTAVDIYALGAVLYALLADRSVFDGSSPVDLLKQVLESTPPSLRSLNTHVDLDLETICSKCLNKNPGERYTTALDLSHDLEAWLNGEPIAARPISRVARTVRWVRKNPMTISILSVAMALISLVFGALLVGYWTTSEVMEVLASEHYAKQIAYTQAGLQGILNGDISEAGERDLRGWEWHYLHGKQPVEFELSRSQMYQAAVSPRGNALAIPRLASQSDGGSLRTVLLVSIIRAEQSASSGSTNKMLEHLAKGVSNVQILHPPRAFIRDELSPCVEWSPDGQWLAIRFQGDEVRIWDATTGTLVDTLPWSAPDEHLLLHSLLKWNHCGSQIALVSSDGLLKIYDLASRKFVLDTSLDLPGLPEVKLEPLALAWGPQEQWLALSDQKATYFFNPQTGKILEAWPFPVLAWTNDSQHWASNSATGHAESSATQLEIEGLKPRPGRGMLAWSPDGERLACMHDKLTVFNARSGAVDAEFGVHNYPPVWFPNSERLMVGRDVLKDISWSPEDMQITIAGAVRRLSVSHAGGHAAFVYQDSSEVQIVDEFGQSSSTFAMHDTPVAALHWSFDDTKIASLDIGGVVRVWDSKTQREIHRFDSIQTAAGSGSSPVHESCWQVWWSPGDRYLAASTTDNRMRVWDMQTSQQVYSSSGNGIRAVGWTEEPLALIADTNFASCFKAQVQISERASFHMWEVATGKQSTFLMTPIADGHLNPYPVIPLPTLLPKENLLWISTDYECWFQSLKTHDQASQRGIETPMPLGPAFSGSPLRMMAQGYGQLRVVDPESGVETMRLRTSGGDEAFGINGEKLWIAGSSKLTVYDGSISPWLSVRAKAKNLNHLEISTRFFQLFTQAIALTIYLPLWVLFDRGMRLTGSQRWLLATAFCAAGLVWFGLNSPGVFKAAGFDSWNWQQVVKFIFVCAFTAIGFAALVGESLRLILQGEWRWPLLAWLLLLGLPAYVFARTSWPSLMRREWSLEDMFMTLLIPMSLGFGLLVIRFSKSAARSGSLQLGLAPLWVRCALYGFHSVRGAILYGVFYLIASIYVFNASSRLADAQLQWFPVLFDYVAPLMFLLSFAILAAALWVVRHGGWQAQSGGTRDNSRKQV